VWRQTIPIRSSGAWRERRSGIKEEAEGRGTAAKPFTPSVGAGTALKASKQAAHINFKQFFVFFVFFVLY
jgi:hypothetical protein